jgi:hypothetical protein
MLNAVTLEVSLDGTHQYTTIQAAVDAASNGDIIHVYPGRYYEHIDILEKTLTIQSQYAVTSNRNDIDNTIIDADFQSNCIRIDENSNVTADGFTMVNGIGYCYGGMEYYGGAVLINIHSIATIQNCIIKNNNATDTGGVYCAEYCEVNLSGNIIKDNGGYHRGGGVSSYNATITFDPVSLNSIYNNYGDVQDIFLFNVTCNDIVLDTLSVNITEPDGFFVSYYAPPLNTNPIPSISVQNSYFNQVDADIYVSPDGDDSNDGLTPESALNTIAYATRLIQPNEQDQNTVYLLPGIYSKDLNNQFFPVSVQSNSKLLGAGETPDG